MQENEQIRNGIIALFGEESFFVEQNGNFKKSYQLNRKYLAQKVFSSQENTQKMNEIVHPAVRLDYQNWVTENQHFPYLLNETALLFESGRFKDLDKVITISSPLDLRIKRIKMRDNRSEEEINQIMQKQISEEEKIKRSDFVIYNDEKQLLLPQILEIDKSLKV
jgi:dephospho-CoA kinase